MRALIELNRYLHDFTSAMWLCGSILLWLIWREARRQEASPEVGRVLGGLTARLWFLTLPALAIALGSGGIRAATFAEYEYVGDITKSVIVMLVAKHVVFAALVVWGVWVHQKSRRVRRLTADYH